jgi:branched-chain amino acid transport system permease protein
MRSGAFFLIALAVGALIFGCARAINNDYVFFAGYTVLQFVVLATAWNILGGYTGYVNFGSAAFFALGAYSSVFFHKLYPMPIPVLIVFAAVISGLVGLGMGYLTLRLRGAVFAIATLALAVVLQTLIVNWNYVGGSRGAYVIRPSTVAFLGNYIQYLFLIMLALAVIALTIARTIEHSSLGTVSRPSGTTSSLPKPPASQRSSSS